VAQEIQIRRRRLVAGFPGGPWSSWSDSVCVPPGENGWTDVRKMDEWQCPPEIPVLGRRRQEDGTQHLASGVLHFLLDFPSLQTLSRSLRSPWRRSHWAQTGDGWWPCWDR
jgi:hypothetical protein